MMVGGSLREGQGNELMREAAKEFLRRGVVACLKPAQKFSKRIRHWGRAFLTSVAASSQV
jgi:hypothetical protein